MTKLKRNFCSGSAAINISMVGQGSCDVLYHHGGLHCWDMVAATLIVVEAGGVVFNALGGQFDYMGRNILACANAELAKQINELNLKILDKPRDHPEVAPL